jgi:hypothetical protein
LIFYKRGIRNIQLCLLRKNLNLLWSLLQWNQKPPSALLIRMISQPNDSFSFHWFVQYLHGRNLLLVKTITMVSFVWEQVISRWDGSWGSPICTTRSKCHLSKLIRRMFLIWMFGRLDYSFCMRKKAYTTFPSFI